jgi:hypothetical protein
VDSESCTSTLLKNGAVTQLFAKGFSNLESYKEINGESYRKPHIRNSPFHYAVEEWLKHAKAVPRGPNATSLWQTLWKLVADFFWDGDKTFREWRRVYRGDDKEFHKKNRAILCLHPRVRSSNNGTGLHVAALYGLVDNLDWAHPAGIDFSTRDDNGWTPLIHAVHAEEEEAVMTILTKEGVDINSVTDVGRTALIVASDLNCEIAIVGILLRQDGIEVDHVCKHGCSALGHAKNHQRSEEIIQMLKQKGATVAKFNAEIIMI